MIAGQEAVEEGGNLGETKEVTPLYNTTENAVMPQRSCFDTDYDSGE